MKASRQPPTKAAQAGERALVAAIEAYRAGRLDHAEAACRDLLSRNEDNAAAHQLLAVVKLQQNEVGAGRAHIERSLALRPDHVASLLVAGRAARAAGDRTAALAHAERAVALAPGSDEPAYLCGILLRELGDPRAAALLRALVARYPRHVEGWCALGETLKDAGDRQAALAAFERAVAVDPRLAKAHFHRAAMLHALERFAEAADGFRMAQSLAPDAVEIAFNLGLTLLQLGTKDAAAAAFARTVALQPSHIEAWFSLGLVRQDLLDLAGAAQAFRSVLAARPEHAEAAVNLGIVLQEAGAMEAAMAAYAEAVRRRPETFGPVVQAMCGASTGRLFLVPGALRRSLARR
jgi:tetratricopeptide (TPR) repeat protein